jgi:hypothetical protein
VERALEGKPRCRSPCSGSPPDIDGSVKAVTGGNPEVVIFTTLFKTTSEFTAGKEERRDLADGQQLPGFQRWLANWAGRWA